MFPLTSKLGMAGYLKITCLSRRTGTDSREVTDFQVNYTVAGFTYVTSFNEQELAGFLLNKVPLNPQEFDSIMTQLGRDGHATIGDVYIPLNEAASLGMEQVADDF